MNFNIIESDYTKEFNEQYELIKQDTVNGEKVKDIKAKYGLSDGRWRKYYLQLVRDGLRKPHNKSPKKVKYYTINQGKYVVQKFYGRRKYHIGTFKYERDAQRCVELMKSVNWDLNQKERIMAQVREEIKRREQ